MPDRRRAVVLYDGECGFCTRVVDTAVDRIGTPVDYEPYQTADLLSLGVSRSEAEHSVHWVGPDGRLASGSAACARVLVDTGGGWRLLGWALLAPPLSWVAEAAYRIVARYRRHLPGTTPTLSR
jgi:predicted DCC family thiol-disulfide oxidoreductase YuxK